MRSRMMTSRVLLVLRPKTPLAQLVPSVVSRNQSPDQRSRRVLTACATASGWST